MDILSKRSYYLEQRAELERELEKVNSKLELLDEIIGEGKGPSPKPYTMAPPGPFPSAFVPQEKTAKEKKPKKIPSELKALNELAQAMKDADKGTKVKHVTETTADKDAKKFLEPGKKYDIVEEEF